MSAIDTKKLDSIFNKFPLLLPVIKVLNAHDISWMMGGSGCLYLLGNDREPGDMDLVIPNSQHDTVDELFKIQSFTYTSDREVVRNSNPENNHDIQFTSNLLLNIENKAYHFDFNEEISNHALPTQWHGENVYLLPPEESLLIKSLLQRGEAEGKHDIEDIKKFLKVYPQVNMDYLQHRITQLNARERVGNLFNDSE